MGERESLYMWMIYRRPLDYPNHIVVRRWTLDRGGKVTPDEHPIMRVLIDERIDEERAIRMARLFCETGLAGQELVRLPRHPFDDPAILEVWL